MSYHGTRSRYVAGCRCDECRWAETLYTRSRREGPQRPVRRSNPKLFPRPGVGWEADANCAGMEPDLWYPPHREAHTAYAQLRLICMACSVRSQCLDDALYYERGGGERHGFVGGKTPDERRMLHRRRVAAGEVFDQLREQA